MSKTVINKRQIILDKALQMFNERGIEYVGLRELAALLSIRVSNITYYFPTKDDLVYELSQELSKANAAVAVPFEQATMTAFLEMLHKMYQNQVRFRCLLLSFVHVMRQNKHLAATYEKTQQARKANVKQNLVRLTEAGYLKIADEPELEFLVSTISLISRFWISEAAISSDGLTPDQQVTRYLSLVATLLRPYSTAKAKREMESFLEERSKV